MLHGSLPRRRTVVADGQWVQRGCQEVIGAAHMLVVVDRCCQVAREVGERVGLQGEERLGYGQRGFERFSGGLETQGCTSFQLTQEGKQ